MEAVRGRSQPIDQDRCLSIPLRRYPSDAMPSKGGTQGRGQEQCWHRQLSTKACVYGRKRTAFSVSVAHTRRSGLLLEHLLSPCRSSSPR